MVRRSKHIVKQTGKQTGKQTQNVQVNVHIAGTKKSRGKPRRRTGGGSGGAGGGSIPSFQPVYLQSGSKEPDNPLLLILPRDSTHSFLDISQR